MPLSLTVVGIRRFQASDHFHVVSLQMETLTVHAILNKDCLLKWLECAVFPLQPCYFSASSTGPPAPPLDVNWGYASAAYCKPCLLSLFRTHIMWKYTFLNLRVRQLCLSLTGLCGADPCYWPIVISSLLSNGLHNSSLSGGLPAKHDVAWTRSSKISTEKAEFFV